MNISIITFTENGTKLAEKIRQAFVGTKTEEAKKLGFKTCIVPAVALKSIGKVDGIEVIGVNSVNQAMNYI